MKKITLFLFVIYALTASCGFMGKRVKGNGNWKTEERTFGSFDAVEVHGAMDVLVSVGPMGPVKVEIDENLQELVDVFVSGNTLIVRERAGYNLQPSREMKIHVTAPVYKRIDVSGAGDIVGQNKIVNPQPLQLNISGAGEINMDVDAPRVEVDLSGSGGVKLSGETKDLDISLSGAANAQCFDLKTENTKIHITGAGDANVFASVNLEASVSGAGSVRYKGSPTVNQKVSGAGSVSKAD